jgi:hypothetical protein
MKMKKQLSVLAAAMLAFSCSYDYDQEVIPVVAQEEIALSAINEAITNALHQHNRFEWSMLSSAYVSSAAAQFDGAITIGYQPAGFQNIDTRMHEIDVRSPQWVAAKQQVLDQIVAVRRQMGLDTNLGELVIRDHEVLPYFHIKVSEAAVIERLRGMGQVRYVEPRTYEYAETLGKNGSVERSLSDSGCGGDSNPSINSADFVTISPNAKAPWTYYQHNIPSAWAYSTGDNVGVGLIDTGLSPNQPKLGSQFASGASAPRSVYKYGTYVDSWWPWSTTVDGPNDKCGHGTSMSGAIASPRNADGMAVGVAYNADLYSVRAVANVVIDGGHEKDGVSDAYVLLANKSAVKVISMSLGSPLSISQVADAIRYAYGRGKLIFCAAGTSTTFTTWYGVIFPASMSETVAVTGIKDNGYNRCDVCHEGSAVDFVVTMQRASNTSRTSLTLPQAGNGTEYVGGSSVATAMTAGTAALVWSRFPSYTREQVIDKMKRAAEFYPNRSSNHGWGKINVLQAVQ